MTAAFANSIADSIEDGGGASREPMHHGLPNTNATVPVVVVHVAGGSTDKALAHQEAASGCSSKAGTGGGSSCGVVGRWLPGILRIVLANVLLVCLMATSVLNHEMQLREELIQDLSRQLRNLQEEVYMTRREQDATVQAAWLTSHGSGGAGGLSFGLGSDAEVESLRRQYGTLDAWLKESGRRQKELASVRSQLQESFKEAMQYRQKLTSMAKTATQDTLTLTHKIALIEGLLSGDSGSGGGGVGSDGGTGIAVPDVDSRSGSLLDGFSL